MTYDDGLTRGSYSYNAKGEKTSETITFGVGASAITKTITRSYEPNGLPKTLVYPGSTGTQTASYNSNDQLQSLQMPRRAMANKAGTTSPPLPIRTATRMFSPTQNQVPTQ